MFGSQNGRVILVIGTVGVFRVELSLMMIMNWGNWIESDFFYGITCLICIFGIRFRINGYIRARCLVLKKGIVILVIGTGGIIRVDMSLMKMMIMHWGNGYCSNSYAESIKTKKTW